MKRRRVGTPERMFQASVLTVARVNGWHVAHFHDSRRQVVDRHGRRAFVGDAAAAGFPDMVLARGPRLVFAELKSANGKVTTTQRAWLWALAATGAEVHIWYPENWRVLERVLRRDRES